MKKLILLPAILIAGICEAQISVGPELGANANTYFASGTNNDDDHLAGGIRVGVKADVHLCCNLDFRPGIMYAMNKYEPDFGVVGGGTVYRINALEVPMPLVYKFYTNSPAMPFIGCGPYAALNVSGSVHIPSPDMPPFAEMPPINRPLQIGTARGNDVRSFDAGIVVMAGLQMKKGFCVTAQMQRGFVNLQPDPAYTRFKYFSFGLNLGYYFNLKKPHTNDVATQGKGDKAQ